MDIWSVGNWLKTSGFPESIEAEFKKFDIEQVKDFKTIPPLQITVILEFIIKTTAFEDHFDLIIPFKSAVTDLYLAKRQQEMGMTNQQRALTMIDISHREMRQKDEVGGLLRDDQGSVRGEVVKDGDIQPDNPVSEPKEEAAPPKAPQEDVSVPPLPTAKAPRPRPRPRRQKIEKVDVNIVESSELESWVVWKSAYCTYCRFVDSPNLPKEHIEIDNERTQSQWRRFSGKVEVNDPLNLWAISYHPSQPKIALYKSYKKICNTIYHKYDPKQMMAKSLKAHRISPEYYIPNSNAPPKQKAAKRSQTPQPASSANAGIWDYQYDYQAYNYEPDTYYDNRKERSQGRAWTTDRIKDWYRNNGYKASSGSTKYSGYGDSSYNKYRYNSGGNHLKYSSYTGRYSGYQPSSDRYGTRARNTDRISRTSSYKSYLNPRNSAPNQWYNYPNANAVDRERKGKKRVAPKTDPKAELFTQETWRGHYIWKKNDVERGSEWDEVEAFIPRIRAQRKKSEYAKSEYLLCWERLKYNENASEDLDQGPLWVKAFNYLFFGTLENTVMKTRGKEIVAENMVNHELRMNLFKLLSKNGVHKTIAIYKKMESEKPLRMGNVPKVSELQKNSTSFRMNEHGVENKTNGSGVEEPVTVSPKAAEVSNEMLMVNK